MKLNKYNIKINKCIDCESNNIELGFDMGDSIWPLITIKFYCYCHDCGRKNQTSDGYAKAIAEWNAYNNNDSFLKKELKKLTEKLL